MTTPEQLQAWRIDANDAYFKDNSIEIFDTCQTHYVAGYLRAKQETEQLMKLAKFGSLVLKNVYGLSESVDALADSCELLLDEETFKPEIEAKIKELLA